MSPTEAPAELSMFYRIYSVCPFDRSDKKSREFTRRFCPASHPLHLYYQQTTHSSNMRLILNLDYRSAPGHPRLRFPLLLAINPSFLHLSPIPISHGSTPLTHGGNADEEREGRRSVAAGYHADRHDGTTTSSRDTT